MKALWGESYGVAWLPPLGSDAEKSQLADLRAQLQRLSTRLSSGSSGQTSPSMRGLLIGNDRAQYVGSDVVLPVQGCPSEVSVCKPFADLLKQHQIDGIQFCWKNVCSDLLNFRREGATDIHGAILAHNMVRCSVRSSA